MTAMLELVLKELIKTPGRTRGDQGREQNHPFFFSRTLRARRTPEGNVEHFLAILLHPKIGRKAFKRL
jgi:hypothetical protein